MIFRDYWRNQEFCSLLYFITNLYYSRYSRTYVLTNSRYSTYSRTHAINLLNLLNLLYIYIYMYIYVYIYIIHHVILYSMHITYLPTKIQLQNLPSFLLSVFFVLNFSSASYIFCLCRLSVPCILCLCLLFISCIWSLWLLLLRQKVRG